MQDFKRNSGSKQIDLPRYYVPLAAMGRVAVRLRLHHRWVDCVPQPVIATMRSVRSLWRHRRLGASKGTS